MGADTETKVGKKGKVSQYWNNSNEQSKTCVAVIQKAARLKEQIFEKKELRENRVWKTFVTIWENIATDPE